jgi:hypothetical protein
MTDEAYLSQIDTRSRWGSLGDRVEDGLHVSRRAGDDFQDFGRRGLLLQQFVAFSGSFSER